MRTRRLVGAPVLAVLIVFGAGCGTALKQGYYMATGPQGSYMVVESAGGGIFVPPGDPRALAGAVTRLADDREAAREMGQRARAYVEQHFDRRRQSALFASVLERVVGTAG